MSDANRTRAQQKYQSAIQRRKDYEQNLEAARQNLTDSVRDLERRGLLQYDRHTRRYDLHPVVRGIAAGDLQPEEKNGYGQRVVDHFSEQAHSSYEEAETLDDVRDGLNVVRTLLKMGRYQQSFEVYRDDLSRALLFNLEANAEILSLLRPFFQQGWAALPEAVDRSSGSLKLVRHSDPKGGETDRLSRERWPKAGTRRRGNYDRAAHRCEYCLGREIRCGTSLSMR